MFDMLKAVACSKDKLLGKCGELESGAGEVAEEIMCRTSYFAAGIMQAGAEIQ
jgi:hypothetical protein